MTPEELLMLLGAWLVTLVTVRCFISHRHKWRVTAVDHGVMSKPRRNATAILYVCSSCGEAKSTTVAGTYQLEDIREALHSVSQPTPPNSLKNIHWSKADDEFAKELKVKL